MFVKLTLLLLQEQHTRTAATTHCFSFCCLCGPLILHTHSQTFSLFYFFNLDFLVCTFLFAQYCITSNAHWNSSRSEDTLIKLVLGTTSLHICWHFIWWENMHLSQVVFISFIIELWRVLLSSAFQQEMTSLKINCFSNIVMCTWGENTCMHQLTFHQNMRWCPHR